MVKKRVSAGEKSDTGSKNDNSQDPAEIEKKELRSQIKKLKSLISQVEGNLDLTKFGDIDKSSDPLFSKTVDYRAWKKLVDTNVFFKKDMQRFTGIYCSKATKTEYVFHYKPYDKVAVNDNFSLQILNKEGKGILGHWVTPMLSIDIDRIRSETPIDDLSMVIPFLKNWKRHIDCYVQRKKQFEELKDFLADVSNCTIESNLSFSGITITLFGVLNNPKDSYFDLTIYLAYKSNETRPCKINTDWSLKKCSEKDENDLKTYSKCLKNHSLVEGLKLMIEAKHPVFWWTIEENNDSLLELNNSSDSDEESFMDRIKSDRKKSLRKIRKHCESKERTKRMKEKRKIAAVSRSKVVTGKENENSSDEARLSSEKTKKTGASSSLLEKRNQPENTIDELVGKRQRVLRQTTISFRDKRISTDYSTIAKLVEIPDVNEKKAAKPKKSSKSIDKTTKKSTPDKKIKSPVGILSAKKKAIGKKNRAVTSTPLGKKIASKVKFLPFKNMELSPIATGVEINGES